MTETVPHLVIDMDLAHETTLEELPYRELEQAAKNMGHGVLAQEMGQRANQASDEFLLDHQNGEGPAVQEETPEPAVTPETSKYSEERILALLNDKLIAGGTWFAGEGMPDKTVDSPGAGKFKPF